LHIFEMVVIINIEPTKDLMNWELLLFQRY
jgi:hypothetical protein